ncbi:cupin [uncultured Sphingomonas sp.]|uniref:cupin n=1 Tax=uncultured Sphingomonas sp. TaxID=158754 RepID=UPI002601C34A|nr:cupin [uncultured Sphingomonas sp.]
MTEPETLTLGPNGWMPNNPALPVLMYRGVVPKGDPDAIEGTLRGNGWRPDWRDSVYPYHHYHSSAHEALACVDGSADVMLGGEDGHIVPIAAGDLLVLPAGTGHCRITASTDFLLVGAYPDGQVWDVCREAADAATLARIAAVPIPAADPIGGRDGLLPHLWSDKS